VKKNLNKLTLIILVALLIAPSFALAAWWNPFSWGIWNRIFHFRQLEQKQEQPLLGGDRDEHGCIGSAGYSWCEKKQKCLRQWEESCDMINDIYPLFSDLKWSKASAKDNKEPVTDNTIKGFEITAEGTIQNNADAVKFFNYYDQKLKQSGWAIDNYFAADGILGSQRGYKKDFDFIVLGYNIKPGKIISGENEPLRWECPCSVTYSIFAGARKVNK